MSCQLSLVCITDAIHLHFSGESQLRSLTPNRQTTEVLRQLCTRR